MTQHRYLSSLVVALCFAIPAGLIFWSPDAPPLDVGGFSLIFPVVVGAYFTAWWIWPIVAKQPDQLAQGIKAGALIGVVAHPVAMLIYIMFGLVAQMLGVSLLPSGKPMTLWQFGGLALFLLFWWSIIAVTFVAWLTAGIGALVGGVIALIHRLTRSAKSQLQTSDSDHPLASALDRKPRNTFRAALLSLATICLMSGLTLFALGFNFNNHVMVEGPAVGIEIESERLIEVNPED